MCWEHGPQNGSAEVEGPVTGGARKEVIGPLVTNPLERIHVGLMELDSFPKNRLSWERKPDP